MALKINAPLAAAYYLKEDLRSLWDQRSKQAARRHLEGWIERARANGLKQLKQMANTLSMHREGVLAYYDVPITTGPPEGTNNKMQLLKRKSYGYWNRTFFKLRVYSLHETRLRTGWMKTRDGNGRRALSLDSPPFPCNRIEEEP